MQTQQDVTTLLNCVQITEISQESLLYKNNKNKNCPKNIFYLIFWQNDVVKNNWSKPVHPLHSCK